MEAGRTPQPVAQPAANAPAQRPEAPAPEFADHHRTARPQHACDLAEGGIGIRYEAQDRYRDDDIEPPIGKRQRPRPPRREIHGDPGGDGACRRRPQHGRIGIEPDHPRAERRQTHGQLAVAAAEIQHRAAGYVTEQVEQQRVLQPVGDPAER